MWRRGFVLIVNRMGLLLKRMPLPRGRGDDGGENCCTNDQHHSTTDILSRLDKVRATGADSWIARCPAHDDEIPSLSIRMANDGKTLLHCHSGCAAQEIVNAVGMELRDLFPPGNMTRPERKRYAKAARRQEMIRALIHESLILLQIWGCRESERDYPREWWPRELIAVARIERGLREVYHNG